jgi:hypothetical protein
VARDTRIGQILAGGYAALAFGVTAFAVYQRADWVAVVLGGGTIVGGIVAFLRGSRIDDKQNKSGSSARERPSPGNKRSTAGDTRRLSQAMDENSGTYSSSSSLSNKIGIPVIDVNTEWRQVRRLLEPVVSFMTTLLH